MTKKAKAKLVLLKGGSQGKEFFVDSETTLIGRWDPDCGAFPDFDLTNDDHESKVSRKHAKIISSNGQFFIQDLGSLNGSFINRGPRLTPGEPYPIKDGDEVIMGKTFFRFVIFKN